MQRRIREIQAKQTGNGLRAMQRIMAAWLVGGLRGCVLAMRVNMADMKACCQK